MEQDSLEQDSSLRDYWKKKENKQEKQRKKERKRKETKGRDSVDRVTGTDQERMDSKASETLDPPCLISPTSPVGGTNHKEQINTSELCCRQHKRRATKPKTKTKVTEG